MAEEREKQVLLKVQEDIFAHLGYYFSKKGDHANAYRMTNRVAYSTAMLLERIAGIRSESA